MSISQTVGLIKEMVTHDYSVIVYVDGTKIYAKDKKGTVISSGTAGTDDDTVIQAALTAASGNLVYLKAGTYYCNLEITSTFNLCGDGPSKTILKPAVNNAPVVYLNATASTVSSWHFEGIQIYGKHADLTYVNGLEIYASAPYTVSHGIAENLTILYCNHALYVHGPEGGTEAYRNLYKDLFIYYVTGYGIRLSGSCNYSEFEGIEITGVQDAAYAIYSTALRSNFRMLTTDGCIYTNGSTCSYQDIYVETIACTTPVQNTVWQCLDSNCGLDLRMLAVNNAGILYGLTVGPTWNPGSYADNSWGKNVIVRHVTVTSSPDIVGFKPLNYSSGILLCKMPAQSTYDANYAYWTFAQNNPAETINNGTGTITAGSTYVDVTHGLLSTPSGFGIIWQDNIGSRNYWVDNVGAITFRVNFNTLDAVSHTFYWSAEV